MRKSVIILIYILIFALIIDPSDQIFGIKAITFLLILLNWALIILYYRVLKVEINLILALFCFISIPIISLLSTILQNDVYDLGYAISILKSLSLFFLVLIIYDLKINLELILIKILILIPLVTIGIYFILFSYPSLFTKIYHYTNFQVQVAIFAPRNFYGYELTMLYYKTSSLMVFALSYFLQRLLEGRKLKFFVLVIIFAFALFVSGTRANLVALAIISIFYLSKFLKIYLKIDGRFLVYISLLTVIILFLFTLNFQIEEKSATVKGGHLTSYFENFKSNPEYLLFGQGLGSEFYSEGYGEKVTHTELTYLELLRTFGVPLSIVLLFLILKPLFYVYRHKNRSFNNYDYFVISYFTYLFIAGTNPLLLSSTGLIAIMLAYYKYYNLKRELTLN